MLPLSDQGAEQPRGFPIVNISIILLNFLMFAVELIGGDPVINGWSLIPKEILTGQDIVGPVTVAGQTIQLYPAPFGNVYLTILTSMFMHGGWLHILGNMLYLFIFGDNVEYNFGRAKYLIFYLFCGLGAAFAQVAMGGPGSVVPNLGASGAIAGCWRHIWSFFHGREFAGLSQSASSVSWPTYLRGSQLASGYSRR